MNPRTFLGKEWWDQERRAAYAENNYHCWACGTHTADVKWRTGLEAHECYEIDMDRGVLTYKYAVALGWPCHNFIHCGRLRLLMETGKVSRRVAKQIVDSRLKILADHHLEPHWAARVLKYNLSGMRYFSALMQVFQEGHVPTSIPPPRSMWKLVVGDKTFDCSGREI
jgi:hypothetical protein